MNLPWKLNGREYDWEVPSELHEHYRVWLENQDVPDQYRDLWPQGMCRVFEAWIRGKEQEAAGVQQQAAVLLMAAGESDEPFDSGT